MNETRGSMQLPNVNSGMLNPYFLGAPLSKAFSILSVAAFVSCEMFELHTSLDLGKISFQRLE